MNDIIYQLNQELNLGEDRIATAIHLLDEGNTVPFISRYRKDETKNLTDKDLRLIEERLKYLRNLNERKEAIISILKEKDKLTPELEEKITSCFKLSTLEDIYRPFKEKKRTKGQIAKEKGLDKITSKMYKNYKYDDFDSFLLTFIDESKELNTLDDIKEGIIDILKEDIGDEPRFRDFTKKEIRLNGKLKSKEKQKEEHDKYKDYASFEIEIKRIRPHQYFALTRGENEKYLSLSMSYDKEKIEEFILYNFRNNIYLDYFKKATKEALKSIILPSCENEVLNEVKERSEEQSIKVFKTNLETLLLTPPLKNKRVLGFDPGFRSGCKYAYVDELNIPHDVGVVYITSKSHIDYQSDKDILTLVNLIKRNKIDYIALGNGTASRESHEVLQKMIDIYHLSCLITIVNESGASVYSASKVGEEEFPSLTVEKRSAISLARRLIDPLSELLKITPRSIGVGLYQHDIKNKDLDETLENVVID